jgi:hypothetical protein
VDELSQINRPVTLAEIAEVLGLPAHKLDRLCLRHGITPGCRINRLNLYGPRQIQRIFDVLGVTVGAD